MDIGNIQIRTTKRQPLVATSFLHCKCESLHFTVLTSHSTPSTRRTPLHSPLHTVFSTQHSNTPHPTFHTPHSPLHFTSRPALCTPHTRLQTPLVLNSYYSPIVLGILYHATLLCKTIVCAAKLVVNQNWKHVVKSLAKDWSEASLVSGL